MLDTSRPFLHLPHTTRLSHSGQTLPAVFLDRDGVINEDTIFLSDPHKVRLLDGVPEALRHLQTRYRLIVVTNQSGIARGLFGEAELIEVHLELLRQLYEHQCGIDAFYFCPHHPDGSVPEYTRACDCRKPLPGMLTRAAAEWKLDLKNSYMIGDVQRDVEAGHAAGTHPILLTDDPPELPFPCDFAPSLLAALEHI